MSASLLYPLLKSAHLLAMATWVGGTLAVVMLLVRGGRLPTMEAQSAAVRVMRFAVNPALFATLAFGVALVSTLGREFMAQASWLHLKLLVVLALCGLHGLLVRHIKALRRGESSETRLGVRYLAVALLLPAWIVGLAVFKPIGFLWG